MKINLIFFLVSFFPLTFSVFLITTFSSLAQSKHVGDCQKGTCWQTYILGKRIIRQYQLGEDKRTVYSVDLKTISGGKTERKQNWVQCSTSEPFVAFIPSPAAYTPKGLVFIHYINPGGKLISNAERSSHKLYWAVCHNIWRNHPYKMGEIAKSLGYSLQLPSNQREVPRETFNP